MEAESGKHFAQKLDYLSSQPKEGVFTAEKHKTVEQELGFDVNDSI